MNSKEIYMKAFETVSFHIVKPCNMGCKIKHHPRYLCLFQDPDIIVKIYEQEHGYLEQGKFFEGNHVFYHFINNFV